MIIPPNEEKKEILLQMVFNGFMLVMFVVAIAAFLYLLGNVVLYGEYRQTNHVCLTLQDQAEKFDEFYITKAEAERCADYEIDAPVR